MAGAGMTTSRFLSTLSLRRATVYLARVPAAADYFYPRSPCGERHRRGIRPVGYFYNFYPRSPCGERLIRPYAYLAKPGFLSTLSLRRATRGPGGQNAIFLHFYPRSPCGERQKCRKFWALHPVFLSTLSLRRATGAVAGGIASFFDFYPRSPCGERHCTSIGRPKRLYFYPRSPCGERLKSGCRYQRYRTISIHALLAESDAAIVSRSSISCQFLSTLSLRRATDFPAG